MIPPGTGSVMPREVLSGRAFDLGRTAERQADGSLRIVDPRALEAIDAAAVDLCDLSAGAWIWSVGRHRVTGEVFAAADDRFSGHPDFDCLWLR
jgi:hypothetical protein